VNSPLTTLSHELADVVEKSAKSVVAINARWRFPASGVLWRPGVIVTADHTIKREDDIHVTLPDGRSVGATIAGRDSGTDLAVLRIDEAVGGIEANDPSPPKVGNLVLAIGRSTGDGARAAMGIVSTVAGPSRTWRGGMLDNLIKLDVSLYPGLSGAAVVDTAGAIHGIATSGLSRFAALLIPTSTIHRTVEELLRTGRVARGYMGIGLQSIPVPANLREKNKIDNENGVIVLSVQPQGPAEKAGVVLGDILLTINAKPVQDIDDVQQALAAAAIGNTLAVTLLHGGERAERSIVIEERPRRQE
jgi:S1-C subfamily serine protease